MRTLIVLFHETGDPRFLSPIPAALEYLRRSTLPDGSLARFYELKTNRPLYFARSGKVYELTYIVGQRLPAHYAFVVDSRLDAIETEYRRLAKLDPAKLKQPQRPEKAEPAPELAAWTSVARALLNLHETITRL